MTKDRQIFEVIADKLASLKDTSELMLDLAYSSLLLNNRYLAEEVQALEECMDELHTEFERVVLSSGFTPEESKDFLGLMRLGVITEKVADAAASIAEVVLRGLKPHAILKRAIQEAEETVVHVQVSPQSQLVGKTLHQARIHEETGMWVLAIRRGKNWIRPTSKTSIQQNDVLIASGYSEGEEDLNRLAFPRE